MKNISKLEKMIINGFVYIKHFFPRIFKGYRGLLRSLKNDSNSNFDGIIILKKLLPIVLTFLFVINILIIIGIWVLWKSNDKKPDQPIDFVHNIHIENVGIDCEHCHSYTNKSPTAGIPAMKICMDCHYTIATNKQEIKKLKNYWDRKEPIPWNKVYALPWHVYFTHKRHIKANIKCVECHGEVKAMSVVRKVRSLEMGWCINCHNEKKAPTDCITCHK